MKAVYIIQAQQMPDASIRVTGATQEATKGAPLQSFTFTVTNVPMTVYIGPFQCAADAKRIQDDVLYKKHTKAAVCNIIDHPLACPSAYSPTPSPGCWIPIRLKSSPMSNRFHAMELEQIAKDVTSSTNSALPYPVHYILTDRSTGDAWIRLTAEYNIPGHVTLPVDRFTPPTAIMKWEECASWFSRHAEKHDPQLPVNKPPNMLRIGVIDLYRLPSGPKKEPRLHTYHYRRIDKKPGELIRIGVTDLKDETTSGARTVDIYVSLLPPHVIQSITHRSDFGAVSGDEIHVKLLSFARDNTAAQALAHTIATSHMGVSLVYSTQKAPPEWAKDLESVTWLETIWMKARLSGCTMQMCADPTMDRVTHVSGGFITRSLTLSGCSVLPAKPQRQNQDAGKDLSATVTSSATGKAKRNYTGGYNAEVEEAFYPRRICLELDVSACFTSIMLELNLDPTDTELFLILSKHTPSTVKQAYEEVVQLVADKKQRSSKVASHLGPLMRCIETLQKVRQTLRLEAYKLVLNGIYGLLGFDSSRYYNIMLPAVICHAGTQWITRARDACLQIFYVAKFQKPPTSLMCVTDSVLLGFPLGIDRHDPCIESGLEAFARWTIGQFSYIRFKHRVFDAIVISARNNYAAHIAGVPENKKKHTDLEVCGYMSERQECPRLFASLLKNILRYLLTRGPSDDNVEGDDWKDQLLRQALKQEEVQIYLSPPVGNVAALVECFAPMTTKAAHILGIQISPLRSIETDKACVVAHQHILVHSFYEGESAISSRPLRWKAISYPPTQLTSSDTMPIIKAEVWRAWYLDRFVANPIRQILRMWPPALVNRILHEELGVTLLTSNSSHASRSSDTSSHTSAKQHNRASAKKLSAVESFWQTILPLATNGKQEVSSPNWTCNMVCQSCDADISISSDGNSRGEWRKRSASGLASVCPHCQRSIYGSLTASNHSRDSSSFTVSNLRDSINDTSNEASTWINNRLDWFATLEAIKAVQPNETVPHIAQDVTGDQSDPMFSLNRDLSHRLMEHKYGAAV